MEKYETFWRRVGAAILDYLILLPVTWGASFTVVVFSIEPTILYMAIPGLISAIYYVLMHYYGGQTLGKMAVKVKVLDDSEMPVNFGQAILRSLPQLLLPMFAVSFSTARETEETIWRWVNMIYGLTTVFSVNTVIVCLASSKRRALHDFLAGTVVVRTDV